MPFVAVLVLAANAGGASVDGAAPHRRRDAPVCTGVRVTSSLTRQPRDLVFSSRDILDLRFEARLRTALGGDHRLRFKVFTPGGFLYQVMTVPVAGVAGGDRSPPRPGGGEARLIAARERATAESAAGALGFAVSAVLPVAGTSITQSSLYGQWRVEPYLDDETDACGLAARFTIRE